MFRPRGKCDANKKREMRESGEKQTPPSSPPTPPLSTTCLRSCVSWFNGVLTAKSPKLLDIPMGFYFCRSFTEYPFICQPVLYYDFDKICAGEIFDESGLGNNGMSRGRVVVEAGYNGDNGLDLSDGFIQLDGLNFKVWIDVCHFFLCKREAICFCQRITFDEMFTIEFCGEAHTFLCNVNRFQEVLSGSFSNDDGAGKKNVTWK